MKPKDIFSLRSKTILVIKKKTHLGGKKKLIFFFSNSKYFHFFKMSRTNHKIHTLGSKSKELSQKPTFVDF